MKLLCINNKEIRTTELIQTGEGLKEGEIYETIGEPFISENGNLCYYIKGLGAKMCCRFTKLIEEKSVEDTALEKLKEEFQLN